LNLPEMSLRQLIAMAYDVAGFRISGAPQWMLEPVRANFYRVQIQAVGQDALTVDQARKLLRAIACGPLSTEAASEEQNDSGL
jgi:uncharacterized protein (TIGR03435 family)